jgi:hypothetical protein
MERRGSAAATFTIFTAYVYVCGQVTGKRVQLYDVLVCMCHGHFSCQIQQAAAGCWRNLQNEPIVPQKIGSRTHPAPGNPFRVVSVVTEIHIPNRPSVHGFWGNTLFHNVTTILCV